VPLAISHGQRSVCPLRRERLPGSVDVLAAQRLDQPAPARIERGLGARASDTPATPMASSDSALAPPSSLSALSSLMSSLSPPFMPAGRLAVGVETVATLSLGVSASLRVAAVSGERRP